MSNAAALARPFRLIHHPHIWTLAIKCMVRCGPTDVRTRCSESHYDDHRCFRRQRPHEKNHPAPRGKTWVNPYWRQMVMVSLIVRAQRHGTALNSSGAGEIRAASRDIGRIRLHGQFF